MRHKDDPAAPTVLDIRLWPQDHDWLYAVHKDPANTGPSFRFPDLISACVSLALSSPEATHRLFQCLATQVALREPVAKYRRESLWSTQYRALQLLQISPANRHPNPRFALDQMVAGCIVRARDEDATGATVLHQARLNMAQRACQESSGTAAPSPSETADSMPP